MTQVYNTCCLPLEILSFGNKNCQTRCIDVVFFVYKSIKVEGHINNSQNINLTMGQVKNWQTQGQWRGS